MRLVIAVGTLVAFLESEVSFQSCPPFCAESVELMSIGMRSIDADRPCGSNPGILFVAIQNILPESFLLVHADSLSQFSPPLCVLDEATVFSQ
eukprot:scaffold150118_cov60-Attheya_sp.AAC.2